ncbi:MAG: dual specificity protein phosphatase family protein [Nitrososphaerota archaeon]|nr:dual specificity protein phosphatase family protein [Nitrososphaerota archaeon]
MVRSLPERTLVAANSDHSVFGPPTNFSFIDDNVSGSGLPLLKSEIDWTKKMGITSILSLTEFPLIQKWVKDLEYKDVPICDHSIPTLDQLSEAVEYVLLNVKRNNKVLVHCLAGKGRTGTVLAAYLCIKNRITPEESLKVLRLERPGSVETKQIPALVQFCQENGLPNH